MPIYEYEALDRKKGCKQCLKRFETIQGIDEKPLTHCPRCGGKVRKVMSWCRAAVMDIPEEQIKVQRQSATMKNKGCGAMRPSWPTNTLKNQIIMG